MKQCNGTIFQIQRWSINDGEGIRSTVFFKGCPLRCQWCANPESWNGSPEVLFLRERCSGCGRCVQDCEASIVKDGKSELDRKKCQACFRCCEACPSGARKQMGYIRSVEEVMDVIKRDAVFYRESGGGVTFSGGEPFAQPQFLRQLVTACSRVGIDTAVETCGHFEWELVRDIFELLDFVFVDIKHMDDKVHRRMTGVGNLRILENIAKISRIHPETIVRVPLIEGVNADEENIRAMCEFLKNHTSVAGVELIPYHDYGGAKFSAVGESGRSFSAPDEAKMQDIRRMLAGYGLRVVDFK